MENLARELEVERMRRTIDASDIDGVRKIAHLLLKAWDTQNRTVAQMVSKGWLPPESRSPRAW